MESNALGNRSELVGQPNLFNHSLHFLLVFGNIPERRLGLGVNRCQICVPWLTLNAVFPPIRLRCVSFLPPLLPCSPGNLSKTCTAVGWTPISIDYTLDCGYDANDSVADDDEVSMDEEADASACSLLPFQLDRFMRRRASTTPSKWATPSVTACRSFL